MACATNQFKLTKPASCDQWTAKQWWSGVASQSRDLAANANESPLDTARGLREWAASRADSPAFKSFVDQARASAAATVQANRPQPV